MSAVEKYTSAHSFGAPWTPVERQAYNRSLQSYFDNCRSVNVHDDWSVAKAREDCQPFTIEIYNEANLTKATRAGIARVAAGKQPLKSQLPRAYS